MSGMRFASPLWLLAGLVVLLAFWLRRRQTRREVVIFGDTSILAALPRTLAERLAPLVPILHLASLLALVVVLARPQLGRSLEHRRTDGIAIQVCLDTSGSMRAMDFELDGERASRMDVVKQSFADFVRGDGHRLPGRPDDLIGLIAFGGYADSKVPLTLDHDALLNVAATLEVPVEIIQGRRVINEEELQTAIGDALALAVDRVKDAPAKSRVIILITDGDNTAGIIDPRKAAELAKSLDVRVYTVGVGSNGTAPFPAKDAFGNTFLQPRPVSLDEGLLSDIASATGGVYQNARDTTALKEVYAEIDKLERTRLEGSIEVSYEEQFGVCLAGALLGLAVLELLVATRFRGVPS